MIFAEKLNYKFKFLVIDQVFVFDIEVCTVQFHLKEMPLINQRHFFF